MASPSPPPPPPPPPRSRWNSILMGKYKYEKELGQGSFSKVHLAQSIHSGEKVAIKVIDKETDPNSNVVAHIRREISILQRVRHPYVVHLFELMATKTKIYIVMEYVRGGELFNAVAKGRLPEETARRYFQQLISAVSFCHGRGVYHRDLKPENLLLDDKGNLKVADFGLSAVAEQLREDGLFHTFCGSPAYMAPEILIRKGYDAAKADIWSCGVILFVLMAGHLPFNGKNVMDTYKKIYKGAFRCPSWFSRDLVRLLSRILDTNPDTRMTMPEIMKNRWFKKGFKPVQFYIEGDKLFTDDEEEEATSSCGSGRSSTVSESDADFYAKQTRPRPASINAFDVISSSSGFNLAGLFEDEGERTWFFSGAPVSKIISKLQEIAKVVSFTVSKKEYSLRLEGCREGAKEPLTIGAEIFELAPSLMVVEVRKKGGNREDYEEFCNKELRPELEKLNHLEAVVEETT